MLGTGGATTFWVGSGSTRGDKKQRLENRHSCTIPCLGGACIDGRDNSRAAKIKIKAAASLEISALTLKAPMLESPVKDLKVRW